MKRPVNTNPGAPGASFNMIEEATALLRSIPRATLAIYYLGAVPFVMAFLYFWTDMSRNPFAGGHSTEAALGVAVSFIWMKFWQAIFCMRLKDHHAMRPVRQWSLRQYVQILLPQAILHSVGLFLLSLGAVLIVPLAWVYAFLQNVTVLAEPELTSSRLRKIAWSQASLWPYANHVMLAVLLLFGLFVCANWIGIFMFAPTLIRMLLGIETAFSRSPSSIINSTSIMAALWLAYLCVDPILKASYLLRCFYGESRRSGEDLKTELRQSVVSARALVLVLVALLSLGSWVAVSHAQTQEGIPPAAQPAQPAQASSIDPEVLDQKIETVIHQSRYAWRMPRELAAQAEDGLIMRFLKATTRTFRNIVRTIFDFIDRILDWIFGGPEGGGSRSGFDRLSQTLPYILVLLAAGILTAVAIRVWRNRKKPAPVAATVMTATPDIADENVGADQLPEDGWTTLGRELLERGEYRLAVRAFYLATLANLAQRNLIGIARFKSNREYESELRRRAHAIPVMLALFGENLSIFERIWYGMHDVNLELVQQFVATVDRIRSEA
jgi:hypothetical protein